MAEKRPEYTTEIVEMGQGMRFKMKRAAVHSFALSNGKQGRWESLQMSGKPAVLLAGLTKEKKLVLVRMFRFPVENWVYELPGGNVEDGEDLISAGRRELSEETGYATDKPFQELCRGWLWSAGTNGSFVAYLAEECRKVKEPARDEVEKFAGMTVVLMSMEEIMCEIARNTISYDPIVSHAILAIRALGI